MIEPITAGEMKLAYAEWNAPEGARIMARFAVKHDVTVKELKSKTRTQPIASLRQDLMLELRENTNLSLPQIGRLFGRDHTTVMWGLRRAYQRRAAGNQFDAEYLEKLIRSPKLAESVRATA